MGVRVITGLRGDLISSDLGIEREGPSMNRSVRIAISTAALAALLGLGLGRAPLAIAGVEDDGAAAEGRDVPSAFVPLEYLLGQWKGQGVPKDNAAQRFRGWTEEHAWAWVFQKGTPTGLSISIKGGKAIVSGRLSYDPDRKRYRLDATAPGASKDPIVFEGKLDTSGKLLVLDQVAGSGKGEGAEALRISFRPNSNFIRYTMRVDHKSAGAFRYGPKIEVGVTKEGESFAASSATAANRPKCIITGGTATMTVSFQGQSFPICCSGCREEFEADPQKYIKKASLRAAAASARGKDAAKRPAPARVNRRDDAFADDVVDAPATRNKPAAKKGKSSSAMKRKAAAKAKRSGDGDDAEETASDTAKSEKPAAPKDENADENTDKAARDAKRAATFLRIGQNLEKSGNSAAALGYYKRIVKDYARSASAKTAKQRIEAIEKP